MPLPHYALALLKPHRANTYKRAVLLSAGGCVGIRSQRRIVRRSRLQLAGCLQPPAGRTHISNIPDDRRWGSWISGLQCIGHCRRKRLRRQRPAAAVALLR